MKMTNGFGGVSKLSGKRRKPYMAFKTVGWEYLEDKGKYRQIKQVIGYETSRSKAFELLAKYNVDPYDINANKKKFKELFEEWIKIKEQECKDGLLSVKSISRYKNANRYYDKIENMAFIDIKLNHLQAIIDECQYGYSTKCDIKCLYSLLYKYAINLDMSLKKDVSPYLNLGKKKKSELHTSFTSEELKLLWNNVNKFEFIEIILIMIYTSFRPSELFSVKEIHLNERYMIAGIKTEAGMDRIIPIHKSIAPFVKKWLVSNKINEFNYRKINYEFNKTMAQLNMEHIPHDCRHTFATMMDNTAANKICIKLIMGHTITDITDGVYTHKSIEQLVETIDLLN